MLSVTRARGWADIQRWKLERLLRIPILGRIVGRKVLKGLGWNVRVCDPPRQITEDGDYVSLQRIIEQCDVISLHTPLIKSGNGSTWHLFDRQRLEHVPHRPPQGTSVKLVICPGQSVGQPATGTPLRISPRV